MSRYLKTLVLGFCLWGCDSLPVAPGSPCYLYGEEQCNYNLQCHNNGCWYRCDAIGDCDPGFLCSQNGYCLPECEIGGEECGPRLSCRQFENGQQGATCQPINCFYDEQCRSDEVCSYSRCTSTCTGYADSACFEYEYCDFDNRDRMTCQSGY